MRLSNFNNTTYLSLDSLSSLTEQLILCMNIIHRPKSRCTLVRAMTTTTNNDILCLLFLFSLEKGM